ncbi:MAG: hypothetical protein EOO37_02280 [Cytophagaceae bacterium]|nr:MAG: hypothetical protein EOO37_02280 [Cytophagaceae bacterium]
MAKTFKTTSAPAAAEPAKPISERDFFDLTDEPVAQPADKQEKIENTGNTNNRKKIVNTDNSKNTSNTNVEAADSETPEERDLRQTFVVSSGQLEQLRDYVHARRATGDYEYSQKQALQEALSLLFASVPQAPPRPSQTRELEQRRRERIRRGRGA